MVTGCEMRSSPDLGVRWESGKRYRQAFRLQLQLGEVIIQLDDPCPYANMEHGGFFRDSSSSLAGIYPGDVVTVLGTRAANHWELTGRNQPPGWKRP